MDIIDAIRAHNLEALQICLFQGQNPNQTDDAHNITPLHFAVAYHFPEAIEPLLKAGADPTARTIDGNTPVMLASRLQLFNIIKFLQ